MNKYMNIIYLTIMSIFLDNYWKFSLLVLIKMFLDNRQG